MIVAALLALVLRAQDTEDNRLFWERNPWVVGKSAYDCNGGTYVEDHDHWLLIYAIPSVGGLSVVYEDKRLTTTAGRTYQVHIKLHQGKKIVDANWPLDSATASFRRKSMGLVFKVVGFSALDDLGKSDAITFIVQGKAVRTLSLNGSDEMVRNLRLCMSELPR